MDNVGRDCGELFSGCLTELVVGVCVYTTCLCPSIHYGLQSMDFSMVSLEESLSIPTGRCDLAIATHARKMHKKYQYDCQLEYFS